MRRRRVAAAALALCCWSGQDFVTAGQFNKVIDVGAAAPAWKSLQGQEGEASTLDGFRDAKAIVVVFMCNTCPVALAYEERLKGLADDFRDRGVAFVAIHVHKEESLQDALQHAREAEFNFPCLHDESQETAKAYGASTTPHAFVLDSQRKIAYMGAVDDNMNLSDVEQHYLRDALEAVLRGTAPVEPETQQFGCSVKWK